MSTDLDAIKSTLVNISKGAGILDTLIEFERTLDNAELFAYKNWILGELVEGPTINRYWYTVIFMFPYEMMPDPNGGLRLTKIGAKVNFKKGVFKRPRRVRGPQDWSDPVTKSAKMEESEVWLVTISLPMKYISSGLENIDDIIAKDIERTNSELDQAYESEEPEMDMGDEVDTETDETEMDMDSEEQP